MVAMLSFLSACANRYTALALLGLAVLLAWNIDRRLQFSKGAAQGRAQVTQAWQRTNALAQAQAAARERDLQQHITKAQNERTTKQAEINLSASANADAVKRLRQHVATARMRVAAACNYPAQTPAALAATELQRTLASAIDRLAANGAEIAAAADGHVADVQMLEAAQ